MSANVFKNDRFNFSDNEMKPNASKERDKSNNVYNVYNADTNSFIKSSKRDNDRRDNDRRDNDRRNQTKSSFKGNEPPKSSTKEFKFIDELFPELIASTNEREDNTSTKFKDTLNTTVVEEEFTGLKPGWMEMYKSDGKIAINYGDLTPNEIRRNELNAIEENPSFIMNKTINFVMRNREKHIYYYDLLNGDGSYNEKYVMSPVYGPEYDTEEEESDYHSDSYDDNECPELYDDC
jgi:hypothetical protein